MKILKKIESEADITRVFNTAPSGPSEEPPPSAADQRKEAAKEQIDDISSKIENSEQRADFLNELNLAAVMSDDAFRGALLEGQYLVETGEDIEIHFSLNKKGLTAMVNETHGGAEKLTLLKYPLSGTKGQPVGEVNKGETLTSFNGMIRNTEGNTYYGIDAPDGSVQWVMGSERTENGNLLRWMNGGSLTDQYHQNISFLDTSAIGEARDELAETTGEHAGDKTIAFRRELAKHPDGDEYWNTEEGKRVYLEYKAEQYTMTAQEAVDSGKTEVPAPKIKVKFEDAGKRLYFGKTEGTASLFQLPWDHETYIPKKEGGRLDKSSTPVLTGTVIVVDGDTFRGIEGPDGGEVFVQTAIDRDEWTTALAEMDDEDPNAWDMAGAGIRAGWRSMTEGDQELADTLDAIDTPVIDGGNDVRRDILARGEGDGQSLNDIIDGEAEREEIVEQIEEVETQMDKIAEAVNNFDGKWRNLADEFVAITGVERVVGSDGKENNAYHPTVKQIQEEVFGQTGKAADGKPGNDFVTRFKKAMEGESEKLLALLGAPATPESDVRFVTDKATELAESSEEAPGAQKLSAVANKFKGKPYKVGDWKTWNTELQREFSWTPVEDGGEMILAELKPIQSSLGVKDDGKFGRETRDKILGMQLADLAKLDSVKSMV